MPTVNNPQAPILCTGEWTGVICSRRTQCARWVENAPAHQHAMVHVSLCPSRDHYWAHFLPIGPTPPITPSTP